MLNVALPIVIVGTMPFALTAISKARAFTLDDNQRTRAWQTGLTGWRKRAYWAHQNAFEAFPLFAALAILATMAQPESRVAAAAAWTFVLLRVLYAVCYLADAGRARSTVWLLSQAANGVLLLVALRVA